MRRVVSRRNQIRLIFERADARQVICIMAKCGCFDARRSAFGVNGA